MIHTKVPGETLGPCRGAARCARIFRLNETDLNRPAESTYFRHSARRFIAGTGNHANLLPLIILAIAAIWRVIVLASNTVGFHSDEAVVGIMALHINQGLPIPTFFYGQPYMGSLDPLLTAIMFHLTGPTVFGIRLVQFFLYLGIVGTTMLLAYRLTSDRWTTAVAGLLIALPPLLLTLYTTISLGGYGEIMILGNLLLILGWELATRADLDQRARWGLWLALGAIFGLGWWTNNLIVAYALPVAILLLTHRRTLRLPMILGAAAMTLLFCLPWWVYNLQHDWESIRFLISGFPPVPGTPQTGFGDRVFNLLVVGIPALIGTRFPWAFLFIVPTVIVGIVYGLILTAPRLAPIRKPQATTSLWIMLVGFTIIDLLSSFGMDPTSRYLLPLLIPLAILVAMSLNALCQRFRWSVMALPILIAANVLVTISAMRTVPPGITSQFDPTSDIAAGYDQQVINFLIAHHTTLGYATYWAAYRLTFLSGESVILTPELPWRASLYYVASDARYPPYTQKVQTETDHPAIVTANLPQLDQIVAEQLTTASITFTQAHIGPYTIFYDLSRNITPAALGLQNLGPKS